MPKSPEVWVVNMLTHRISLEPMRRTGNQYYVHNHMYGTPAHAPQSDVDLKISNFNEYDIEWMCPTTDSNIYLVSSKETGLKLVRQCIDDYHKEIVNLTKMLHVYDVSDDFLLNVLRSNSYGACIERGQEDISNVHIGYIERSYSDDAGTYEAVQLSGILDNAKTAIGDCIGADHTVLVNVGTLGTNVYLKTDALSHTLEAYRRLPQVCNELSELWELNSSFGLCFTHWYPEEFEYRHFANVACCCLPKDYNYQDIERLICRQFAKLLGVKSRTAKHKKSPDAIRQFVLSPNAARTIENIHQKRDHMVMEYSISNNPMDDCKYYGLSKLPTVLCHQRPDGSIHLKVSVEPEHIVKLTQKTYQDITIQKQSVLDAILETHS